MRPILPCPACSTFLLLPEATEPEELTCPDCRHTIPLSDLATWEVGAGSLELSPAESPQTENSPYGALASAGSDRGTPGDSLSIEADEPTSDELQLAAADTPARPVKPAFNVQPITHEQFERMKRKKRSPFWSVAQIVLGGFASIPIALLILWHGLGRDVADAGPTVARYIPWIVPERFHPLDMGENSEDIDEASDQVSSERERGESGFRQFDEFLPPGGEPPGGEPPESDDEPPKVTLGETGTPSASSGESEKSGSASPPGQSGSIAALSRPREDSATTSSPSASKGSMQNSSAATSPNVILQIKSCEQHIEAWRVAVRDGKGNLRELAQEIYGDLVGIAAATKELPDGSPYFRVVRDAMQPLSQAIKRQDDIQNLIIQGAEHWSRNTDRLNEEETGKALTIICEIEQVTESETEWIIQPRRENLPKSVSEVRIPRSIAPSLQAGQELLLLGTLAQPPSSNAITLAEIQGKEPPQESEGAPNAGTFQACYLYAF